MKKFPKKFPFKSIELFVVTLILAALLLVVFKDIVFTDSIFVKRDISRYYYPVRSVATEMLRQGEIPLWNPYVFCGIPLHASVQNSVFYPLSAIYYLMDVAKGFSIFILVHILLCGLFTYAFMRYRGISREGSFLAAVCFTFSGYIMSAINLTIALNSVTWFPLALLVFFFCIKKRKLRYSALLSLVLLLMFMAGDPSILMATFAIIFFASLYLFIEHCIKRRRVGWFFVVNFLLTLLFFILLSAFKLIPAIEYFQQTVRANMQWSEAAAWSVPVSDFLSLIIPYFNDISCYHQNYWIRQSWLDNYYIGITTIFIALFAIRLIKKDRLTQFLCVIAVATVVIVLGKNFIVYPFLYKVVPLLRIVRYPVRFFFVFTFSICAMAGIGYDRIREAARDGTLRKSSVTFLITALAAAFLAVSINLFAERIGDFIVRRAMVAYADDKTFKLAQFPSLVYADLFNLRRTLLYISCFGLFVFLWSRATNKKLGASAIFLVVVFDLLLTNTGYEPIENKDYVTKPTENIEYILKDESLFRICASPYSIDRFTNLYERSYHKGIKSSKDRLVSNRMMEFGIYDMWGYDSTVFKRSLEAVVKIYESKKPSDTKLLDLLNVKYVSSHGDMDDENYEKVHETENATIYRNKNCLERAFLVRNVKYVKDDEAIIEYISSEDFKPGKEVVLEEDIDLKEGLPNFADTADGMVEMLSYKAHTIDLVSSASRDSILVLSDTYYPGWKVYVDGQEEKIYRANYFLRGVRVPAGEHVVQFVYKPFSFFLGALISIITILTILLYTIIGHLRLTRKHVF
ncbi:YfhO family protein [Candidatus Omnitrophota bacterium]